MRIRKTLDSLSTLFTEMIQRIDKLVRVIELESKKLSSIGKDLEHARMDIYEVQSSGKVSELKGKLMWLEGKYTLQTGKRVNWDLF